MSKALFYSERAQCIEERDAKLTRIYGEMFYSRNGYTAVNYGDAEEQPELCLVGIGELWTGTPSQRCH